MYKLRECPQHGITLYYVNKKHGASRCMRCAAERQLMVGRRRKLRLVEYKGGECSVCGFNDLDRPECFDFHHTEPTSKSFQLGGCHSTMAYKKQQAEVDKCILICSNCHKTLHKGSQYD